MEILHFCPSRSFSGLEQYALQVAVDQRRRGREVGFVVSPGTRLEHECKNNGIDVILFNPFNTFGTLRFWPSLRKLLGGDKNLKILHVHSTQELFHISVPVMLQKIVRAHRPKVVLQSHIWINHKKKDALHRLLYSVVDEVWCASEIAKRSLIENLPVEPGSIRVMNYGRDVGTLESNFLTKEAARSVLRLPREATIMGTVSRIEESKGIRDFLEASVPLLDQNRDLHLAVIGATSPNDTAATLYNAKIHNWLASLSDDLRARIHFLGLIPESYKFLRAFDVYVLPSHQETFSLSLLDTQLAGLPVVGSASGGTPEVVREGETGWLFRPKEVEDLRGKLAQALESRTVWTDYGTRAASRVREEFDQQHVFEDILTAYESHL